MTYDDIKLIDHKNTGAKQFGFWIKFRGLKSQSIYHGRKGRKDLISFFESKLGPLGSRWQYQKLDQNEFILKINSEKDFLILLLKLT
jgi:hypothetical protein